MASLCTRCSLRLQRQSQPSRLITRTFCQSTTRPVEFPTFTPSTNKTLNDTLAAYRDKHLVPAFLTRREQQLIFSPHKKDYLKENPTTIELGGQEIKLQWFDRHTDRPARIKLVKAALEQIFQSKDGRDWENVAKLLQALKEVHKAPLEEKVQDKIVRKAVHQGQISQVLKMLQHADKTSMSLKSGLVLKTLVMGVRNTAQRSGWEKEHVIRALEMMQRIAQLLETEQHGAGRNLVEGDPRMDPFILGVQLELVSVYAYKHNQGVDENETVARYADRLLCSIGEEQLDASVLETKLVLRDQGAHSEFQQAVPILHGVFLANKMLGEEMPQAEEARRLIAAYEHTMSGLAAILEGRAPAQGSYDHSALETWRRMIRD